MKTLTIIIGPVASSDIDWAEIRGWVTIAIAVVAAYFAGNAFLREKRRDYVNRLMRIQTQASQVAIWQPTDRQTVQIKNTSDLPVTQVLVIATREVRPGALLIERDWAGSPEGAPESEGRHTQSAGTFEPDSHDLIRIDSGFNVAEVLISFVDAQGVTWLRSEKGILPTKSVSNPEWMDVIARIDLRSRVETIALIVIVATVASVIATLFQQIPF